MTAALQEAPSERPRAELAGQPSQSTNKRAMWDWAIWIAGAVYLAMVLFLNLYSPAFGVVLIILAGYEVIEPRFRRPNAPE